MLIHLHNTSSIMQINLHNSWIINYYRLIMRILSPRHYYYQFSWKQYELTHGRTGRGGGSPPPSLLGKQSQSGNIRSTVGQYWLIIKINGTNSVNFVGNFVISGKFVWCFEKIWYVRKIFGPLKWYTDRNFFGEGGGWGVVGRQN
jgi:hypothetical protein